MDHLFYTTATLTFTLTMLFLKLSTSLQALLALLLSTFRPASGLTNYPAAFNFGDSNSDTGGLVAGLAFSFGLPDGETYFRKPSGRFCDGRLIIDFLMDAMELPFLNPYLDSVGAPSFRSGINFATAGSTIQAATPDAVSPFYLDIQVSQFVRFKSKAIALLSKDRNLQAYLPDEDYFKRGLYMVDVGQNDIDGAFYSKSEEEIFNVRIPTAISKLEYSFKRLYNEGARNFWIHNTGPLGCLPRIIARYRLKFKQDQLGCIEQHNNAASLFNKKLYDLLTGFKRQYPDTSITYVDIYSMKLNLISNSLQFGFRRSLAACCGYGGLPLNYDPRVSCGQSKKIDGEMEMVAAKPCENSAEYVNWDGSHYTEAANKFVAQQILAGYHVTHL